MAIVQEPSDALFPDMPRNALENVPVDHAVPLPEVARLLSALAGQPVAPQDTRRSTKMESRQTDLTCPECRGPISESHNGQISEFSCRVGHRYSPETFLAAHAETRERTLWAAVVALEEGAEAARDLATHRSSKLRHRLEQEAGDNESAAKKIRGLLKELTKGNSGHLLEEATDSA
jgi:two-component system chemotaxis response regulator CheB